jgi:Transposase and inactivated derivatives
MITIGIDIGKFNHCACVVNSDTGQLLVRPFFFKNNLQGFNLLLSAVNSFSSVLIGLEDTGHYGDNLIFFLLKNNLSVALINPIATDLKRKSKLKSSKNDKLDCLLITKVLLDKDDYRLVSLNHYHLRQLKQLTRHHHDLKEDLNVYKNRLQKNIDLVFPEFNSLFKSKYGIVYMRVLKLYSSANIIANTDIRLLRKSFNISDSGRRVSLSAETLKVSAFNSVGETNPTIEIEIKHLISMIELLESHINEIDTKIEEFSHQLNSPIISIPGISHFSGMAILSEYGDILRFDSAAKLVSFAGVNPYEFQSGSFKASHTSITKKGSSYLRKTLYQIALPIIKANPVFHSYYSLKRSQGKSHRCALGHVVRKLLRVIFHLLSNDISFDPLLLK